MSIVIRTSSILVKKTSYPEVFDFCKKNSELSKSLYNAALFRIRNNFTGRKKEVPTENEALVLSEIEKTLKVSPGKVGSVISYFKLEKLMRITKNPDFFDGLPAHTAQHTVKDAVQDFKNWLSSVKAYKEDPSKFLGKPKMPGYVKSDSKTVTVSNQEAVLYPDGLKLPGIKERIQATQLPSDAKLKEVKIKSYYNHYMLLLVYETDKAPVNAELPFHAGLDLGVSNIAAIMTDEGSAFLFKGGALKAENQWYHKETARLKFVRSLNIGSCSYPIRCIRSAGRSSISFWSEKWERL